MITRPKALKLLHEYVNKKEIIFHSLACEAIMKALASHFNEKVLPIPLNENEWGIVGLLHDLDYQKTRHLPKQHTLMLEKVIKDIVNPEMLYAMKSHNWQQNGIEPKSLMDWSISCCDELSGFIMMCAKVHIGKNLKAMNSLFILNKFNDINFIPDANREQIELCEWKLSIPLPQFLEIALIAMQKINDELGFTKNKKK
ncbi:MAG: phosphohydrolase [Candidatus Levybacteria bacterium]|nr:phosphohydrolase [Candidatus Levybacteria bacterium]MSU26190.1 phosphohydrolase [Candidatus Levybacteria bacterium]